MKQLKNEIIYSDMFVSDNKNVVVNWAAKDMGFGQFYFYLCPESGRVIFDTEFMNKDFIKSSLNKIVEDSIFTDFTEISKASKEIKLHELNSIFPFKDNSLFLPFFHNYNSEIKQLQMRWKLDSGSVLNVTFEQQEELNLLQFCMKIQKNKNFDFGFISAEIWDFTISPIKLDR